MPPLYLHMDDVSYEPVGDIVEPPVQSFSGWRLNYLMDNPLAMPAVLPATMPTSNGRQKYIAPIEFTKSLQLLSWELMQTANDLITKNGFHGTFAGDVAFTNHKGWIDKKDIKYADYVNGSDLSYPNPSLLDAIMTAGSLFSATESADGLSLILKPNVNGIDVNRPLPSVATIIKNNWFFYATNKTNYPSDFAQGKGKPVAIPLFLREDAFYEKAMFSKYSGTEYPDHLKPVL